MIFFKKLLRKISIFFQQHGLAFVFFLAVALLLVAPQFLAMHSVGNYNTKAPFLFQTNEDSYMTRIQEIIDGYYLVSSPNFYEYKNIAFPILVPVAEYWYAIPVMLFDISLSQVMIANKFLLPFILCWLVYFFVLKIIIKDDSLNNLSNKWAAILATILVVLGYELVDYRYLLGIIAGSVQNLTTSVWTRPVNPISGAIFLFSFFIIVWKVVEGKRKWIIPGSIMLALMVGYFFSLAFAWAFLFSLVLLFLYKKDWKSTKSMIYIFLLHFLFSFPFWYNVARLMTSKQGLELSIKNGMYLGHSILINKFVVFGTILFLLFIIYDWYKTKKIEKYFENRWIFIIALLFSSWIVYTQQVITGRTIWYHHFVQYTIPVVFVILTATFYNVFYSRQKNNILLKIIIVFLILSSFSYGIVYAMSYKYGLTTYSRYLSYVPVYDWLNANSSKDCVVLMKEDDNEELGRSITAFTHCNVYLTNHVFYGVPEDRIMHNYMVLLMLKGIELEDVKNYFEENQGQVLSYFFKDYDQSFGKIAEAEYTALTDKLVLAYTKFNKENLISEIKKYRIDYLISTEEMGQELTEKLGLLDLLFTKNNLYIYSLDSINE